MSFLFFKLSCKREDLKVLLAVLTGGSECFRSDIYMLQPLNFLLHLCNVLGQPFYLLFLLPDSLQLRRLSLHEVPAATVSKLQC